MRRREFFEQVPRLFAQANKRLWESYEETIFRMCRPVTHGNYWYVRRYVGGNPPQSALTDARVHHDLNRLLLRAKYPDADALGTLEDFTEETSEFASALLHFNNPAYPIYDDASVRGLNALGVPTSFHSKLEPEAVDAYRLYTDSIQELKDEIPFQFVPERNYYLTRVVQEALWQLGKESPVPSAMRKAPSRRIAAPGSE